MFPDEENTFDGESTKGFDEEELHRNSKQKIGFVFQMFYLLPKMNALDNVKLPMIYTSISDKGTKKNAQQSTCGSRTFGSNVSSTDQISGGQQQRVSIARALVNHPKVILQMNPPETSIPKQK